MADHSFDADVASEVGVIAATIYKNIQHYCEKARTNGKNIHDGKAWTYNSVRAWRKQYPYLSEKQIRTALKRLEDAQYISVSEYNKDNRDRTKWYCDLRVPICPEGQLHLPKRASPTVALEGKPLPDSNPVRKEKNTKKENPCLNELCRVLDNDLAQAVIEHRKSLRKPLTERAAQLLAKQFEETGIPNQAAEMMIMNGWQGFNPDWMAQSKKSNSETMVEKFARAGSLSG